MFFTRKEVNASYARGEERKKLRTPSLTRDSRFSAMENAKQLPLFCWLHIGLKNVIKLPLNVTLSMRKQDQTCLT